MKWFLLPEISRRVKLSRELVKDINDKDYDLVIIGIRGLGETNGNLIGSVCERVVRRINTDVLVY